jgi:hypothetical protein
MVFLLMCSAKRERDYAEGGPRDVSESATAGGAFVSGAAWRMYATVWGATRDGALFGSWPTPVAHTAQFESEPVLARRCSECV